MKMNKRMNPVFKLMLLMLVVPMALVSCKKEDDETQPTNSTPSLEVRSFSNLFANDSAGHFTFYSLRSNAVIGLGDSATNSWDLAFRGTTILVNGGTSGPGNGGA